MKTDGQLEQVFKPCRMMFNEIGGGGGKRFPTQFFCKKKKKIKIEKHFFGGGGGDQLFVDFRFLRGRGN